MLQYTVVTIVLLFAIVQGAEVHSKDASVVDGVNIAEACVKFKDVMIKQCQPNGAAPIPDYCPGWYGRCKTVYTIPYVYPVSKTGTSVKDDNKPHVALSVDSVATQQPVVHSTGASITEHKVPPPAAVAPVAAHTTVTPPTAAPVAEQKTPTTPVHAVAEQTTTPTAAVAPVAEHTTPKHESAEHTTPEHESAEHSTPATPEHESAEHTTPATPEHESTEHESTEHESTEHESAEHPTPATPEHEVAEHSTVSPPTVAVVLEQTTVPTPVAPVAEHATTPRAAVAPVAKHETTPAAAVAPVVSQSVHPSVAPTTAPSQPTPKIDLSIDAPTSHQSSQGGKPVDGVDISAACVTFKDVMIDKCRPDSSNKVPELCNGWYSRCKSVITIPYVYGHSK